MNFVVIGTDHNLQRADPGLEGLIRGWRDYHYTEPIVAIAEEHSEKTIGDSIGRRLAKERNLCWYDIDMTDEEKRDAGILVEQRNRPPVQGNTVFRVPSDEVRENHFVKKLTSPAAAGTTLVICGYLHQESLVKKLKKHGAVDQRTYLETGLEIRG
jgi:hypothetical protein